MKNHCVLFRTRLQYDGRVVALINSLAMSFPNDRIYLYQYPMDTCSYVRFPKNVVLLERKLLFSFFGKSHFIQQLKALEYALASLFFMILSKPETIQVHHEVVALGPLIYKLIYKRSKVVYDDKEFYHPSDNNIPNLLYYIERQLIMRAELIISCNQYRAKALRIIHGVDERRILLLDNLVFDKKKTKLIDREWYAIVQNLKSQGYKIIIHQGKIDDKRGVKLLSEFVEKLDETYVSVFIGASDDAFTRFKSSFSTGVASRVVNLGFIDYSELSSFYEVIDAAIVFYSNETFNNKFCAPNRLYLAINSGKPVIVNKGNTVLCNFVEKNGCGLIFSPGVSLKGFDIEYKEMFNKASQLEGRFDNSGIIDDLLKHYQKEF